MPGRRIRLRPCAGSPPSAGTAPSTSLTWRRRWRLCGRAERNALFSQIERLIEHLLKLEYASATEPRRQWIISVDDARRGLERHLTPSLRKSLEAALPDLYVLDLNPIVKGKFLRTVWHGAGFVWFGTTERGAMSL